MKNITFDGRHAIAFSLLTDVEKRNLLSTVKVFEELPNGWFIAKYSGLCVRLTRADVEDSSRFQSVSGPTGLVHKDRQTRVSVKSQPGDPKQRRLSKRAPGAIALKIVDFLCNARTVEKTFKPLVADWRIEYFEALAQNRRIKARWVSARYIWYFALALGITRVWSVLRPVLSGISSPKRAAQRDDNNV